MIKDVTKPKRFFLTLGLKTMFHYKNEYFQIFKPWPKNFSAKIPLTFLTVLFLIFKKNEFLFLDHGPGCAHLH
jgi:hypothetical protein